MGKHWRFELGERVAIKVAGEQREQGEVIGRAEYNYAEPSFLIRYVSGTGASTEGWWTGSSLESPDA